MIDIPFGDFPTPEEIENFKKTGNNFNELVEMMWPVILERNPHIDDDDYQALWIIVNQLLLDLLAGSFRNETIYKRVAPTVYLPPRKRTKRSKYKPTYQLRNIFRTMLQKLMDEEGVDLKKNQIRKISKMAFPHLIEFINRYSPHKK